MGWASRALFVWKRLSREADPANHAATLAVAERGEQKAKGLKHQLGDVYDDLRTVLRLIRSYASGDYRAVSWSTLAAILGAIVYFLMPMDAIPDWLLAIGLLDDIAILARVFSMARTDIQAYRAWESAQPNNANADQ